MLAFNEATGTTDIDTVTDTFLHCALVLVELNLGGETTETTPQHPFPILL